MKKEIVLSGQTEGFYPIEEESSRPGGPYLWLAASLVSATILSTRWAGTSS
jgi:hypothetical protein